jgi:pimeloyl-ACP methyl ester carboxylesterase
MMTPPHRRSAIPYELKNTKLNLMVHEWGAVGAAHVVVCAHGLSRNGRSFDVLASELSKTHRVLCPDFPGRGHSDWFDSAAHYNLENYCVAMQAMLTHCQVRSYDWVGTSMGGLVGMALAADAIEPMQRFVINDVGPHMERAALERIAKKMALPLPAFDSYETFFHAVQGSLASFGPLTIEQQHHLIRTSCHENRAGQWVFNMDPQIGLAFVNTVYSPEPDLWPLWQANSHPTLVLRGEHSGLLSCETVTKMCQLGSQIQSHEVPATGHAPMLMDEATISVVCEFLRQPKPVYS